MACCMSHTSMITLKYTSHDIQVHNRADGPRSIVLIGSMRQAHEAKLFCLVLIERSSSLLSNPEGH